MCLVVFSWQPGNAQPLLLLANRDEVKARPSAALAQWSDQPSIYAGRDLEAGGTWLGVTAQRHFAALTNIRGDNLAKPMRSRGALVSDYLTTPLSAEAYARQVGSAAQHYSGFNLLLGDLETMWYVSSRQPRPVRLSPGIYALCNGSLDTPWPKLVRIRSRFAQHLQADDQLLLALMQDEQRADDDQLPDTGVGLAMERMLSSIFIRGEVYGTRVTQLVRMFADGAVQMTERSYALDSESSTQVQLNLPPL